MKVRLIEFLNYLQISQGRFEKKVGISNGFVSKVGDSIRESSLDKILKEYPNLNINWLKTGQGEMLINNSHNTGNVSIKGNNNRGNIVGGNNVGNNNVTITADPDVKKIIGNDKIEIERDLSVNSYIQTITAQKERIADLERIIEAKDALIDVLKKVNG